MSTFTERLKLAQEYKEWLERSSAEIRAHIDGTRIDTFIVFLENKGYFRAPEVRKKTAKEILQKLREKDPPCLLNWEYGEGYFDCMKAIKEIISEYGVEVEE